MSRLTSAMATIEASGFGPVFERMQIGDAAGADEADTNMIKCCHWGAMSLCRLCCEKLAGAIADEAPEVAETVDVDARRRA